MAKGDHSRMQNQVDYQGGLAQNHLDNTRTDLKRQNQSLENRYNVAADQGNQDYGNLMGANSNYLNSVIGGPSRNFGAYSGYQNFAETGGYSPEDIQNIRARSVAPMRATYANANREVDRSKALTGGYSPNYAAAKAKMARELSYGLADAGTNAEASIAEAVRNGKLAGLGGMTNIDSALLNSDTQRMGIGANILGNMTSLYGQAPGMAQMYGNQMGKSNDQMLTTQQLQQDIMRQILGGQNDVSNTTGNFQSAMGNLSSAVDVGSDVAGLFNPQKYGAKK